MSLYRPALASAPHRIRIIRLAASRAYANAPTNPPTRPKGTHDSPPLPPPGSKLSIDPAQGGVNTLVWVGALTAAAGGVYWYSTTSKGAAEKDKAEAHAREMKAKADIKMDEGKAKANELKVGDLLSSFYHLLLMTHILITSLRARQLRNTTLRKLRSNRNIKGRRPMHRRSMIRARALLLTSMKRQRAK